MMRLAVAILAGVSFAAAPRLARAQAPAVTPEGDPSVDADTIYALAADSSEYPEQSSLLLLGDGIVRVDRDGTGSRSFRQIRQALREDAVEDMAELRFGYDAGREEFSLNWARVVEADGTVVSEEPIHVQELDAPVPEQSPIYTDRKIVRVSIGGIEPGRILDYSYTTTVVDPALEGDFGASWRVDTGGPVRLSRFILDTPAGLEPRVLTRNLSDPPARTEANGRVVREWRFAEIERVEPEPFAADSNDVLRFIRAAPPLEWDDIGAWYAELARDRYTVTPELEAKIEDVVADAASLADSLRALHRWVAQDIRYVSISLGMGGYRPRAPADVLDTGSGDCKDKTTIFVAAARRLGVEAYPVIVSTGGTVRTDMPTIRQFNHMVAAVQGDDGEWTYLDLTIPIAPYGHIPPNLQGDRGLLVRDDGSTDIVDFPQDSASANRSVIAIEGVIDEDGGFTGMYTEHVSGALQYRLRAEFARRLTERQRDDVARNLANRVFEEVRADSIELFDGRDLDARPQLRAWVEGDGVLDRVPGGYLLPLPLQNYGPESLIERLEDDDQRRFPIDAEDVFGLREHFTRLDFTLPEGWTADLPEPVRAESVFGTYESTYEKQGRTVSISRRIRGTSGVLPPDRLGELIQWLRAISEDDVEFLALRVSATNN